LHPREISAIEPDRMGLRTWITSGHFVYWKVIPIALFFLALTVGLYLPM
jgi:hypothetical protein